MGVKTKEQMQINYKELSDTQWQVIRCTIEDKRKRKHNLREVVNGILEVLRTGVQWRNLRRKTMSWQLMYYYFRKWKRNGTLEKLNTHLNQIERLRQGKTPTPSLVCIDSQSIKASSFIRQDKGIDGNKLINGRKRHIMVDTLGLVWSVKVHAANIPDGELAHKLVEPWLGYLHRMKKILVDSAYKIIFLDWAYENIMDVEVEIAVRPPTTKGFVLIKWRWVVERTFAWWNAFRRHAKDYEKTASSAEAWILWANCQIILNRIEYPPN